MSYLIALEVGLFGEERTLNLKLASSFVTTVLQVKWLLLYFYKR